MTDPLTWSISLGRWGQTRVRAHALLLIFAAGKLFEAAWIKDRPHPVIEAAAWLALLMLALAIRLMAQAAISSRVGGEPEEIRLWPLGHLAGPGMTASERSPEAALTVLGGMAASLGLALGTAIGLRLSGIHMVFNPFGSGTTGGAPFTAAGPIAAFKPAWWFGWFGYLNWVLFVANLIPAMPLDGGRVFRAVMASRSRDGLIGPWTARACAAILALIGLVRWLWIQNPGGPELIGLALLIEWMVRIEARMLDEGGFFDEGVFGYDFSQGYTSLEAGAPTVRPFRESALKRWRRRRSDLRRRRREARVAAEEQRMDEILQKIHQDGRASLTDEENRFLVRVSALSQEGPGPLTGRSSSTPLSALD